MIASGATPSLQVALGRGSGVSQEKSGELRFCGDFRGLDEVTAKDVYPLPRGEGCLGALDGPKCFRIIGARGRKV